MSFEWLHARTRGFDLAHGYLLPITILLGVGISIVSVIFMQTTTNISQNINKSMYNNLAQLAAQSGAKYADSCIAAGVTSWSTLKPNTDCSGVNGSGVTYLEQRTNEYTTSYEVTSPNSEGYAVSTGTVTLASGDPPVIARVIIRAKKVEELKPSTGKSITQVAIAHNNCYLADGEAYCSGADEWGELGQGPASPDQAVNDNRPHYSSVWPKRVQGALAGKTVTKIVQGTSTVCAIADGLGYCWGDNVYGQLGLNRLTDHWFNVITAPPYYENTPRAIGGLLSGKYIQDISAKQITQTQSLDFTHATTCAVSAGVPYCWGSSKYGEAGIPKCTNSWNWTTHKNNYSCSTQTTNSYAAGYNKPNPLWGYAANNIYDDCNSADWTTVWVGIIPTFPYLCTLPETGIILQPNAFEPMRADVWCHNDASCTESQMYGKKVDTIQSGAHTGCAITQGRNFCWGLVPPLAIIGLPTLPIKTSTDANGLIDPYSTGGGADFLCYMANFQYTCMGRTLAIMSTWSLTSLLTTQYLAGNSVDVQKTTNTTDPYTTEVDGFGNPQGTATFCMIINGTLACSGKYNGHSTALQTNSSTSTSSGLAQVSQISSEPGGIGMAGRYPTDISAGERHSCAVANGQLFCWGTPGWSMNLPNGDSRGFANPIPPYPFNLDFGAVPYPTLMSQGTGVPAASQIGTEEGTIAATDVASGGGHSCGTANGALYCWGNGANGQLGNAGNGASFVPVSISPFNSSTQGVTKVTAGDKHTCAISNGELYCWGSNSAGQLGMAGSDRNTPQKVTAFNGKRVSDVSAGYDSTCAIANMLLYCWGSGTNYKTGLGSTGSTSTPTLVNNGSSDLKAGMPAYRVSVGYDHACAVGSGDVYCWGNNADGQTGLGTTTGTTPRPKHVTGGQADTPKSATGMTPYVSEVAAGKSHTCAIFNNVVKCWGLGSSGQLGTGSTASTSVPTSLSGTGSTYYATRVTAGDDFTCALLHGGNSKTNGNLFCWGNGANYHLGNGSTANSTTPVRINGGDITNGSVRGTTTAISSGSAHSCSVTNARILCWGAGGNGRLGDGASSENLVPNLLSNYTKVSDTTARPLF